MANIQKTLDALQPYVIGIRYLEGTPVVDAVFKEGWTLTEDNRIKRVKGNNEMNYYMIFSEVEGIGLDDLLSYVEKTIKLNQEREKKHELLRSKVNELKEIFKKNSLTKLQRLSFTFSEEELVPSMSEFDIDIDEEPIPQEPVHIEEPVEEIIQPVVKQPETYVDENNKPIELTDEDRELLEEEARAERNRVFLENQRLKQKTKPVVNNSKKVELPPKRKIEMAIAESERDYDSDCDCRNGEACDKCIDSKDL